MPTSFLSAHKRHNGKDEKWLIGQVYINPISLEEDFLNWNRGPDMTE